MDYLPVDWIDGQKGMYTDQVLPKDPKSKQKDTEGKDKRTKEEIDAEILENQMKAASNALGLDEEPDEYLFNVPFILSRCVSREHADEIVKTVVKQINKEIEVFP